MSELWQKSAREVVSLLRRGEVSPLDAIDVSLARIGEVDARVNAVPTLCVERARERARRLPEPPTDGRGWLAGLPVLIKDLVDVEGVRTTYGCTAFADNVPTRSAIEVRRLERHGAVVLGKTNTPEFGAGAQTFNEVFGATRNPWDLARTCAGSSGGAAVALATGMAWLADGSDVGGSLRTPASFCSVVGLRPSPGRVPHGPASLPFDTLGVEGPMARDVRDCALLLDAMAGFEPGDPLSFDAPARPYVETVEEAPWLGRVAFSVDLGGITPVDSEVAAICAAAAGRFAELGAEVEEACPDFSAALDVFTVLRAARFAAARAPTLARHRHALKPEVVWNIEHGLSLNADAIGAAERRRAAMQQEMAAFMETHDLLLSPAAIVPPFPVEQRYVEELNGHRFPSYIDWVTIAYAITLMGCPALSLPCGFTRSGLPVGLQIVGRPRGEAGLLAAAAALEDVLGLAGRVPMTPAG
ncbi:MAG TPA: amidase family protein [Geminicoccaceae bacterium]|nr:amidase family protein [Geminicoccus sp.]HMU50740.1 amidase family protein [Geminicoccaceae bacterium]